MAINLRGKPWELWTEMLSKAVTVEKILCIDDEDIGDYKEVRTRLGWFIYDWQTRTTLISLLIHVQFTLFRRQPNEQGVNHKTLFSPHIGIYNILEIIHVLTFCIAFRSWFILFEEIEFYTLCQNTHVLRKRFCENTLTKCTILNYENVKKGMQPNERGVKSTVFTFCAFRCRRSILPPVHFVVGGIAHKILQSWYDL